MEMFKAMQDFGHQPSKTTTLVYFCSLHRARCAEKDLRGRACQSSCHPAAGCMLYSCWLRVLRRRPCFVAREGSFGLRAAVCRALADMKDKLRQTLGSATITNEPRWSFSCGKSLFTNTTCCSEEHFLWEISIYKLNWTVSCGKFLFTNSTGAFRVGNF